MKLFNASSLFTEIDLQALLGLMENPSLLKNKLIETKKKLLSSYNFSAYGLPDDFTKKPYIIATNHLTDSDAPLIMSYYYSLMKDVLSDYPRIFVFAKEDCFNGVSIPKELLPILDIEKVVAVDRKKASGSLAAIKTAKSWVKEGGEEPRHFLIFPQGTLYDINIDAVEDIERGAFWLSSVLEVPILPAFLEQAVEGADTRLVFGSPIIVPKGCKDYDEYKAEWMKQVIHAQNSLEKLTGVPARKAVLDQEHRTRKRFNAKEEH